MKQLLLTWKETGFAADELDALSAAYRSRDWRSVLFHLYVGEAEERQTRALVHKLREDFPTAEIVGMVSAGEIKDGRLMEDGILVSAMLFESTDIEIHRFRHVKDNEREIGARICAALDQIPDIKGAELLLPGAELDTRILYEEIEKCAKHIQIFGGYAGGHTLECAEHYVLDRDGVLRGSMLVITYAGRELSIDADRTVGWQALGAPYQVTKANKNWVIEIDHRPAAELYKRFLQIDAEGTADESLEFPLMATIKGERLLRGTTYIDKSGSVLLAGYVTEGMDIQLSYGNPSEIVEHVNQRLEALRHFQPQAILLYSCLARKTFWEEFVDMEMVPFASLGSTVGCHTWGEVERSTVSGSVFEYNETLLSIAFREGPRQAEELPPVRVDDSVLRGQASIMKRLTKLVSATTQELQQAYRNMEEMNAQLSHMNEELQRLVDHDSLTGIYNRGKIEAMINDALDASSKSGQMVSLVMLDADYFKQINDSFGHSVGDKVLMALAKLLQEAAGERPDAAAGRWGGEEFFVLLPNTEPDEALSFAQTLHERIQGYSFPMIGHLTVSMGVISGFGFHDRQAIFTQVDNALYQAKNSGRNKIVQCRS